MAFSLVNPARNTSKIPRWPTALVDALEPGLSSRLRAPTTTGDVSKVPDFRPQTPPPHRRLAKIDASDTFRREQRAAVRAETVTSKFQTR